MKALVLTADGIVRNSNLVSSLEERGFKVEIVNGIKFDPKIMFKSPVAFPNLMKRDLNQAELCTIITHRRALQIARNLGEPTIFLEDDCSIGNDFTNEKCLRLYNNMKTEIPTICSLYFKSWNILLNNQKYENAYKSFLIPPVGAVAYMANAEAIKKMLDSNFDASLPADWPIAALEFDFVLPKGDFVHLNGQLGSLIGDRSIMMNSAKFKIPFPKSTRHAVYLFKFRFAFPILWKLNVILQNRLGRS